MHRLTFRKIASCLLSVCITLSVAHAADTAPDPFGAYDPPITATFGRATDDVLDTNFFVLNPDKTWTDNLWTDLYRDTLGIIVAYDWIATEGVEYDQKLRMAVNTGDIPQFINVNAVQLRQLVEMDAIQPLGEAYEAYAAPLTREVLSAYGSGGFDTATFDGKLYGLPITESYIDGADLLWIRTDWLEALGFQPPTTMEEAVDLMIAFANADMDVNQQKDDYGLVFTRNLWDNFASLRGFFNGYGAYPGIWVPDGDGLVYGSTLPGNKEALAKLRELAALGVIDVEFGWQNTVNVAEKTTQGNAGLFYGAQWNSLWPLQANKDRDPDAQWQAFPIVYAQGVSQAVQSDLITTQWTVCRKDVENPEAIVKMFNLFIEKCWGETEEHAKYYAPIDAESVWKLSPVVPYLHYKNLHAYEALTAARESGDYTGVKGEAATIFDKLTLHASGSAQGFALWGWERIYGEDGAYSVLSDYLQQDMYLVDQFLGIPGDTMVDRMDTLVALQNEVFTKIILGDAPLSAFDDFVESFYALGGDQITRDVNAWYHSQPGDVR